MRKRIKELDREELSDFLCRSPLKRIKSKLKERVYKEWLEEPFDRDVWEGILL